RLTRAGRLVCAGAVVATVLGAVGGSHPAVGLGLAALAGCALGRASVRRGVRQSVVREGVPPSAAVRGDRIALRYTPVGPVRGGPDPLIRDALLDGERRVPLVASGWALRTPPLPRGVWRLGTPNAEYRDRLGLATATAVSTAPDGTVTVRPAVLPEVGWVAVAARRAGARHPGSEDAFEVRGVRDYLPGDDLRLLDWRSTVRTGRLHVREPSADTAGQLAVLLDTGIASAGADHRTAADAARDFETAVDCAASVAVQSLRLALPVALACGDGPQRAFAPAPGVEDTLLDALAAVRPQPGRGTAALNRAAAVPSGGALAVLVTTRDPDLWRPALSALAIRYAEVVCVRVTAPDRRRPARRLRGFHLVEVADPADLAAAALPGPV
ncbi:DUF58 domain-containing protein, partial [Streptomyces sp.]|uniref:DUF58 domain-containing protein n=1 Tax=Streptomyces sp. TaxID=1931 RepID=UPI002F411067